MTELVWDSDASRKSFVLNDIRVWSSFRIGGYAVKVGA